MTQILARDKKQILIRVKPEIRKALRRISAENDLSLSKTIEQILEASLAVKDNA